MIKQFDVGEKISPTFMIKEAIRFQNITEETLQDLKNKVNTISDTEKSAAENKEVAIELLLATLTDELLKEFIKYPGWKIDYITKNKPLYTKYKDKWDSWYEKNKEILNKREIYAKLEWQVGVIKEEDSIFSYFIQVRQSGIRVRKANYFPTLVAISQIPIYGREKRYITPRECLRLQSFPDDFKIHPEDRVTYKQAGNSVNVENVRNVIESTLSLYR